MRYMHSIFGHPALAFDDLGGPLPAGQRTPASAPMLYQLVQVYMDDILIFSRTREEHRRHVRMVLETLRHHQLYAKASKCEFGRSSVSCLGHIISARVVAVDPCKIEAIRAWARPVSCTDVRRFVGLSNYYRKSVKGFATLLPHLPPCAAQRPSFVGRQSSSADSSSSRPP